MFWGKHPEPDRGNPAYPSVTGRDAILDRLTSAALVGGPPPQPAG
jgi:hypothetical protein